MRRPAWPLTALLLLPPALAAGQQPLDPAEVTARLEKDGHVEVGRGTIRIEKFDFMHDGANVEAILVRPTAPGHHPGLVMIPGHSRSAPDYLPLAVRFAREGLACLAISQRGYGRSAGEPDCVGPKTIAALQAGLDRFAQDPNVDPDRIGVLGYSRGALAAAILATQSDRVKAAVLAGGIYDFQAAYQSITLDGIRQNMEKEAGLGDDAARARSPIARMDRLQGPVLILHGAKDQNAPVSQAESLRDRLQALGKAHEVVIYPDRDHDIGMPNLIAAATGFLRKALQVGPPGP